MFEQIRLAKYQIDIIAGERGLILPPYKGATLRGSFGQVFRRMTCSVIKGICKDCILKNHCVYSYIFETAPPPESQALRNYENIPRPFLFEPPLDAKREYKPGEKLSFDLLLIGKAIQHLPFFIVTFKEMGAVGLGYGRRPFILEKIISKSINEQEKVVYFGDSNTVNNVDFSYSGNDIIKRASYRTDSTISKVKIDFFTPIRLKDKGELVRKPVFHTLFRQAMRRISSLSYFHNGEFLEADYAGLTKKSKNVCLIEDYTYWQEWERYSRRQRKRMSMGGLLGSVVYEGNLTEFLPWLFIGEEVHVGKNSVFGLGKYRISVC